MSTTEDRASGELREGYAEVGDLRRHKPMPNRNVQTVLTP